LGKPHQNMIRSHFNEVNQINLMTINGSQPIWWMCQFCITLIFLHLKLNMFTQFQFLVPCYMAMFVMWRWDVTLLVVVLILFLCCHFLLEIRKNMFYANTYTLSLLKGCLVTQRLIFSFTNSHWVGMKFIVCCCKITYVLNIDMWWIIFMEKLCQMKSLI
jgi:hypothetical protein